jgi:hypothetical protein
MAFTLLNPWSVLPTKEIREAARPRRRCKGIGEMIVLENRF